MPKLDFYPLGGDPEKEAVRLRRLYSNDGVDEGIRHEFEATVRAYTTLSLPEITERIIDKYRGEPSAAAGCIAVYGATDIGMAVWGVKEFMSDKGHEPRKGINVSAWLLHQHRGNGLGGQLITFATKRALMQSTELGIRVWTSIRPANIPSVRACKSVGFEAEGVQVDKPDRQIFVLTDLRRQFPG